MPQYRVPHARAHLGANAGADTGTDERAHKRADERANSVANAEPNEHADYGAHSNPDTSTHIFPDGAADTTAARRLRPERIWAIYPVLEDVRRGNATTNEIHRGGAGARRQGVRQLSRDALVQQCGVQV